MLLQRVFDDRSLGDPAGRAILRQLGSQFDGKPRADPNTSNFGLGHGYSLRLRRARERAAIDVRARRPYRLRSLSGARIVRWPWPSRATTTVLPVRRRSSCDAGTSTKRAPSLTMAYGAPSGPTRSWPRNRSGVLARNSCRVREAIPSPTARLSTSLSFASLRGSSG